MLRPSLRCPILMTDENSYICHESDTVAGTDKLSPVDRFIIEIIEYMFQSESGKHFKREKSNQVIPNGWPERAEVPKGLLVRRR